jgi:hypothetical protein
MQLRNPFLSPIRLIVQVGLAQIYSNPPQGIQKLIVYHYITNQKDKYYA